ncbi:MAG: hypothetical protein QOH56_594 [Pseudonocardiales bacterium]|nr:hypothetical protein [Pseudonocardiales bacterium]
MAYGHVERNRAAVQPITWEPVGTGIPQRLPGCGGEHLLGRFAPGEETVDVVTRRPEPIVMAAPNLGVAESP